MNRYIQSAVAAIAISGSSFALACSSCGCSLSSDWESQGLGAGTGLRFDVRYDYLNQNQIRSGTSRLSSWPAGHEQEQYTRNHYVTATLDYSATPDWGVSIQLPYIYRTHATIDSTGDDGTSKTHAIGDVRVIGRYQGFSDEKNLGLQFGLKLPTGDYQQTFNGGALAGQALDRGLQAGTGTTDALVGGFHFAPLSQNWDYFVQALAQVPLYSKDEFKPGSSVNVNLGFRYMASEQIMPQLQVNARIAGKDAGANAAPDDSGGKIIYLSPGVTFPVTEKVKLYAFIQWPVYQNLNGYQLAPKYTASVGTRFQF